MVKLICKFCFSLHWFLVICIWAICIVAMVSMNSVAESSYSNTVLWKGECLYNTVQNNDDLIYNCNNTEVNTHTNFVKLALNNKTTPIICKQTRNDWNQQITWNCSEK